MPKSSKRNTYRRPLEWISNSEKSEQNVTISLDFVRRKVETPDLAGAKSEISRKNRRSPSGGGGSRGRGASPPSPWHQPVPVAVFGSVMAFPLMDVDTRGAEIKILNFDFGHYGPLSRASRDLTVMSMREVGRSRPGFAGTDFRQLRLMTVSSDGPCGPSGFIAFDHGR